MAKIRKSIIGILACLVLLLIGVCALTACGSKDLTVTFSIEGNEQVVDVVDGKVTFPADPTKDYYEFRGWYTTESGDEGTEFTADTKISGNVKVYAYFAPIYVDISLNGGTASEIKLADLSAKTSEYTADALSKNLTFDGWYIDAAFGTKYSTQDADNLYARYVAEVKFDNGYEVLHTQTVTQNSKLTAPHTTVNNFVKPYMDEEDISYVDEEGNAIDFDTYEVAKNTTIKVLWKTPGLKYSPIEGQESKYYVSGIDMAGLSDINELPYPAVSVLSKNVTVKADGTKGEVVAVTSNSLWLFKHATTMIFNEGIEYIAEADFTKENVLENLILPSTLKVLENSFSNLDSLKNFELPQGLEVIINCFWGNHREQSIPVDGTKISANVKIPSSVTNLAIVPIGLDLSANNKFVYENGMLYKVENGEKILCSVYQYKVADNRLAIEDGVTGIQVGVLDWLSFDYLYLPSTFKTVGYNNKAENYSSYIGEKLTESTVIENPVTAPQNRENRSSYAIVGNLEDIKYVIIDKQSMPSTVSDYAFVNTQGNPYSSNAFAEDERIVFTGNVSAGESVRVTIKKVSTQDSITQIINLDAYKSGDILTENDIITAAQLNSEEHVWTITCFGNDFVDGTINCNQYITVEYRSTKIGYTYIDNGDGTATVTGFNQSGAEQLGSGLYRVNIHYATADGLIITAIADEAFMNNAAISEVYIANGVKKIGERAFKNMSNLTLVSIAEGGLEEIGVSAFENVGCIDDSNGKWIVNTAGGVKETKIVLPLGKMKNIAPYAFKSRAIKEFTPVDSEKTRCPIDFSASRAMIKDEFYFNTNVSGKYTGIIKYTGVTTQQNMKNKDGSDVMVNIHDVQYVAYAAGGKADNFIVGFSLRYFGTMENENVLRFEMMEGSVYFLESNLQRIKFGIISKAHANAFTDCELKYVTQCNLSYDLYITLDQVQNQDSEIFENGWFNGLNNSDTSIDTLMKAAESEDNYCMIM